MQSTNFQNHHSIAIFNDTQKKRSKRLTINVCFTYKIRARRNVEFWSNERFVSLNESYPCKKLCFQNNLANFIGNYIFSLGSSRTWFLRSAPKSDLVCISKIEACARRSYRFHENGGYVFFPRKYSLNIQASQMLQTRDTAVTVTFLISHRADKE